MKQPKRPKDVRIGQGYSDGVVTVYSVSNTAAAGYAPVATKTQKIKLAYEELRLGINRYYMGLQNQQKIERVIRVQDVGHVTSQDVAVTEDGTEYRIDLVQRAEGIYPVSVDLTLVKVAQS